VLLKIKRLEDFGMADYKSIKADLLKQAEKTSAGLTEEEKSILNLTADLVNQYGALESVHESEMDELALYIHQIQYLIARRVARRVDPDIWV
jgi:hypothetical protein